MTIFQRQEKLCNVTVVYWGWQLGPHRGYGLLQQPLCGEVLHDVSSDVDARNDVISEDIVLRVSGGPGEVEVDIWLGAEVVLRGKLPKDVLDALDFAVWQLNARTSYSPYFVTYGNPSEAVVTRQVSKNMNGPVNHETNQSMNLSFNQSNHLTVTLTTAKLM